MTLSRRDLSTMVQFMTGHAFVRYHLFNTKRSDTKVCRKCGEEDETTWHLMATCPALTNYRQIAICRNIVDVRVAGLSALPIYKFVMGRTILDLLNHGSQPHGEPEPERSDDVLPPSTP